jgi:sulfur carrier protein
VELAERFRGVQVRSERGGEYMSTGATIVVNGEPNEIAPGTTVAGLVASLTGSGAGVAVAVNGEVVPRGAWSGVRLGAGDRVEVLTAVQGG